MPVPPTRFRFCATLVGAARHLAPLWGRGLGSLGRDDWGILTEFCTALGRTVHTLLKWGGMNEEARVVLSLLREDDQPNVLFRVSEGA
jgi:hypothetical protein